MNKIVRHSAPDPVPRSAVLLSAVALLLYLVLFLVILVQHLDWTSRDSNELDSLAAVSSYHLETQVPDRLSVPELVVSTPDLDPKVTVPALVVVLDDFGNQWNSEVVQGVLALDVPLTLAVIPHLWASERVARAAIKNGKEVIVHLPMQPVGENASLEKHYLHASMDNRTVDDFLEDAIRAVPGAIGLNNHMGSAATQDSSLMARVAGWCGRHNWLILDSITHPSTVLYREADRARVPAVRRDIFLDHRQDEASIRRQLERAVDLAKRRNGPVVVIGHPHRETWNVLHQELPGIVAEGISLLHLSDVVYQP
ncbi:divergent polysaccharide deacetylase family protein [bacterium]|nr:divergent polysaccharide deacetylase family protein [bacterium]